MPPLAGLDEARRFHRMALLYIAQLKVRGEPVGLHQFLLGQALGLHKPSGGDGSCAECRQPSPCRTVLLVMVVARFPVRWTPVTLAAALSAARLWPSTGPANDVTASGRLEWGDPSQADPSFRAERDPRSGRWLVRTYEHGALRHSEHFAGDEEMCEHLIGQVVSFVFPYAWRVDDSWAGTLAEGAPAARQWWSSYVRLPYLDSRRDDGAWEQDQS